MGLFEKNGKWYIDYYFQGRRVRECVGTKTAAKNALNTRKAEILQGRYHWADEKGSASFDALAKEFEAFSKANKRSWRRDLGLIKNLSKSFHGRQLKDITPLAVERYKQSRLRDEAAPATVNREVACLKHMFNLATQWGSLRENPLRSVKLLREDNIIERILTPDEERRLIAAANDPLRSILAVALNTGMRLGEILTLPWSCVDFERALITVVNPKNGHARKIPVNDVLNQTLRTLRTANAKDAGVFVFGDRRTGKPFGSVKTAFKATLRRAAIKGLRFHDMRHTFATRLVSDGIDLVTVKELLGHSDIGMTMRYAHPSEANLRNAVAVLAKRAAVRDGHQMDTMTKVGQRESSVSC